MKAVIMAGGEGTRLRPLTCGRPKPMVPVVNKPVMEHIIDLLKMNNIKDMAATLQYMPDMISEYFGDGDEFGIKMRYYVEKKPLGTAGSVKNAEKFLNEPFLVISGDALTDIDLMKAIDFHYKKDSVATLVLKRVDIPLEYGVVVTDREDRIIRFLEKPCWGEVFSDTVNTGIYILSPEIFDYIKPDTVFDFSRDLFPILLKEKKRMFGYIMQEYWCDIGDICAYSQAHVDILSKKVRVKIPGHEVSKGIWIGDGTVIDDTALLNSPCIIGSNCHIRSDVQIGSHCVIGDYCTISEGCGIKKSVIWKNSTLSRNVQLRGSIICNRVHLKEDVCAFEQSVVGEDSLIDERAVIKPAVKIWPDKYVEQCANVETNLVWGSKTGRQIFGNRGVSGEVNVEITPEFSAKLGAAYASLNTGKDSLGIASDGSAGALMIKSSIMSGMLSSGVRVSDFKKQLLPAFRSAIRFYRLDGGVYISACQENRRKIFIDFLDKMGSNIARNTERKLENVFVRDDFHRCEGDCLKNITEVHGFDEFYIKGILQDVKSSRLLYRIALHSSSDFVVCIIKDLLEGLGCNVDVTDMKTGVCEQSADVAHFCRHVRDGGFDLGVSIEESCEKMMLTDERGRLITDDMFIALISLLLFRKIQGRTVVVPLSASNAVEKLAGEYHGKVVRTKTSQRDIMGRLLDRDAKEELLEQFTLHFDSVAGLVKLLDYMSVNKVSLSNLVDMLPEIHMRRQEVECNWNAKGKVIRRLIQEHSGAKLEMLEGVKVYNENGWVLVLPDAEKPLCTVISEGSDAEFAEELTNIYVRKVREISRS